MDEGEVARGEEKEGILTILNLSLNTLTAV